MELPTSGHVAAILGAADDRSQALAALAAFAGLQLGEAAGRERVLHVEAERRKRGSARPAEGPHPL